MAKDWLCERVRLRPTGARVDPPVRRHFLLYVGAPGGYKNFASLLRAYAASGRLMNDFDLLAFGGGPINAREAELIRQLGIPPENLRQVQGGRRCPGRLVPARCRFCLSLLV